MKGHVGATEYQGNFVKIEVRIPGVETFVAHVSDTDIDSLTQCHNHLSMQAGAYKNATWVVGTAKCGIGEGSNMVGQSVIIAPSREIGAMSSTLGDLLTIMVPLMREWVSIRALVSISGSIEKAFAPIFPDEYGFLQAWPGDAGETGQRAVPGAFPEPPAISRTTCEKDRKMAKKIYCAFGTDLDSVAGWLGSYGGEDSPSDIQRGVFASEVGVPRLLRMFKKYDLPTTFFIPGHSLESFPDQCKMIVDHGHEVGAHGYSHENPVAMSPAQEEAVLVRSIEAIEKLTGKAPRGYVAPWWEMSAATPGLLSKYGFTYDHSQGYRDFVPFYSRVGDDWTRIDYTKPAEHWMKPMTHGKEIDLVEIGANWYVDDLPPMMFIKTSPNSHGFVNPRDIEELWRDQFDWVYREMDYAVFAFTIHPDVSGRPQVLLMLERLIAYINGHDDVEWATFENICDDFRKRYPFGGEERPPVI